MLAHPAHGLGAVLDSQAFRTHRGIFPSAKLFRKRPPWQPPCTVQFAQGYTIPRRISSAFSPTVLSLRTHTTHSHHCGLESEAFGYEFSVTFFAQHLAQILRPPRGT